MRIYEINSRVRCQSFDQISNNELKELSELGFNAIWLMGVWQISDGARKISRITSEDYEGSPYAVPSYKFNNALGGKRAFSSLRKRAHAAGLAVIVDFVSNHMAVDSPLISRHPEFFIRSDTRARKQSIADFFLHASGEVVAYGRDPYFPPWTDTSQLDYSSPELRAHMIETLRWISDHADGVRCDMAMLVLRDYVRHQWYPLASEDWFNERMPAEFWQVAINEVKRKRPDFKFIAEAYWDKEEYLISLGFDLAYEKKTYDALIGRNPHFLVGRLTRSAERLRHSLFFTENHDEERAAAVFNRQANLAAAALILSLPGSKLIHEGQMEGRRERLPVQRIKPLTEEIPDLALKESYAQILKLTSAAVFQEGSFYVFDSGAAGVMSFFRQHEDRTVAYIGQIGDGSHSFAAQPLDVSPLARYTGAYRSLRLTNLLTSSSISVEEANGRFRVNGDLLGVNADTNFCIIEASAAK